MRSHPKCIITGAHLVIPGSKYAYGDLHMIPGRAFIFNAVLDRARGDTAWTYGEEPRENALALVVEDEGAIFERRGVLIVGLEAAHLNAAARAYVKEHIE